MSRSWWAPALLLLLAAGSTRAAAPAGEAGTGYPAPMDLSQPENRTLEAEALRALLPDLELQLATLKVPEELRPAFFDDRFHLGEASAAGRRRLGAWHREQRPAAAWMTAHPEVRDPLKDFAAARRRRALALRLEQGWSVDQAASGAPAGPGDAGGERVRRGGMSLGFSLFGGSARGYRGAGGSSRGYGVQLGTR